MRYFWNGTEISEAEHLQLLNAGLTGAASLTEAREKLAHRERRNRIAEGFAFALITAGAYGTYQDKAIAVMAAHLADALIAELDKS